MASDHDAGENKEDRFVREEPRLHPEPEQQHRPSHSSSSFVPSSSSSSSISVRNRRNAFEGTATPRDNTNIAVSSKHREDVDSSCSSSVMEQPKERGSNQEPLKRAVIAYPSSVALQQLTQRSTAETRRSEGRIMETIPSQSEDEDSNANHNPIQLNTTKQEWWIEMEDRVDRYHRSVLATHELSSSSSTTIDDDDFSLRLAYEEFAEHLNPLGQVMAVSLYKGLSMANAKHQQEIERMIDAHAREVKELVSRVTDTNLTGTSVVVTPTSSGVSPRNEAFRQRWKTRMGNNNHHPDNNNTYDDEGDGPYNAINSIVDTKTDVASTVLSNMSCRELSIDRYRAQILQKMKHRNNNKPLLKKKDVASTKNKTITVDKQDDLADLTVTNTRETTTPEDTEEIQRLLDELQQAERRQKLLEKQLQQAGVVLAEDIPYQLAKDKVASISERMNEIGSSNVTHEDPLMQKSLRQEYFNLEKDMQKYMTALSLTDEYVAEQQRKEEEWEASIVPENIRALRALRSYMPVNIRRMTDEQLSQQERPLSKTMIRKFRRTNVLQLLRVDVSTISKWHASNLEAYRVTGLTLTERRALHHHLLPLGTIWNSISGGSSSGGDPMTKRKLVWYQTLKTNFREALNQYERQCNSFIGKPLRPIGATSVIDYFKQDGGLGFPMEDVYEDPMTVVSNDDRKLQQKTAAEIIAEARRQEEEDDNGRGRVGHQFLRKSTLTRTILPQQTPTLSVPIILPSTNAKHVIAKKKVAIEKSFETRTAAAKPKPLGLLAAIAARRIE